MLTNFKHVVVALFVFFVPWSGQLLAQEVFTDEAAFAAAIGPRIMVNFDAEPDGSPLGVGEPLTNQYSSIGVIFEPFASGDPQIGDVAEGYESYEELSLPNWLQTKEIGGGGGGFRVVFTEQPVSYFGLNVVDLQDPGTYGMSTLELFDVNDNSIVKYNLQDVIGTSPAGVLFFGVKADTLIKHVEVAIGDMGNGDYVAFDNLQFRYLPIPVPTSTSKVYVFMVIAVLILTGMLIRRTIHCSVT